MGNVRVGMTAPRRPGQTELRRAEAVGFGGKPTCRQITLRSWKRVNKPGSNLIDLARHRPFYRRILAGYQRSANVDLERQDLGRLAGKTGTNKRGHRRQAPKHWQNPVPQYSAVV